MSSLKGIQVGIRIEDRGLRRRIAKLLMDSGANVYTAREDGQLARIVERLPVDLVVLEGEKEAGIWLN